MAAAWPLDEALTSAVTLRFAMPLRLEQPGGRVFVRALP